MARQASPAGSVPRDCEGVQRLLALSGRFLALQTTDSDGAIDLSDDLASSGCIRSLVEVSRLMGAIIPHFVDLREHADKEMARHAGEVAAYVISSDAISKASRVAAEAAQRLGSKCPKGVASCAQRWVLECACAVAHIAEKDNVQKCNRALGLWWCQTKG